MKSGLKQNPAAGSCNVTRPAMFWLTCCFICLWTGLTATLWHTYTNTNNVTDVVKTTDHIYTATWGGVVEYKLNAHPTASSGLGEYIRTITSVDGLADNDIRTLAWEAATGDIWAGTYNNGITIIKPNGMQTLDATSGLPSNKIRRIAVFENYIYVATDQGISQFYYLPGVYFPLLLHQYNNANTQGGLDSDDIRDITLSAAGYLYCATSTGITYVHTDSLDIDTSWHSWKSSNSPLSGSPVLSVSAAGDYVALNTLSAVYRHPADPFSDGWLTWTRTQGLSDSVSTVTLNPQNLITIAYGVWNEDNMTLTHKTDTLFALIDAGGNLVDGAFLQADYSFSPGVCTYRIIDFAGGSRAFATWGEGIYWTTDTAYYHLENNCIGFQTISEIATDARHHVWVGSGWLGGIMTRKGTRGVSEWSNGEWTSLTTKNSPLPSDNIRNIAVDANDNKWFGSWDASGNPYGWSPGAYLFDDANADWKWYTRQGVKHYVSGTGWSSPVSGTLNINNNTIADIAVNKTGDILISSSGGNITVFDSAYRPVGTFQMPSNVSTLQSTSFIFDSGTRYFFGLNIDNKLVIWDNPALPTIDEDHWVIPAPSKLSAGAVYGVVTIHNAFDEEENWIATSQGLYMWNGTDWYRYDTDIKRRRLISGDTWVNDVLYYVDEERLFGSVRTTPTAIFLDPFNRIWIGSLENGFSMYDPDTETFTNYFQGNSPLLSNYITCFGYDPLGGNLLIGTPDGLNMLQIGIQVKTETAFHKVQAFPNPFLPERDGHVSIVNMPSQSMPKGKNICRLYDSSGALVIELKENLFARFDWNGRNSTNKKCSSGIYFYVVSNANGETRRGKLALIQ